MRRADPEQVLLATLTLEEELEKRYPGIRMKRKRRSDRCMEVWVYHEDPTLQNPLIFVIGDLR